MRFAGISDIHVRNNSRIEEYEGVFERLYQSLKEKKVDAILIPGDTFHHKSTLSPESIVVVSRLLINLSEIAPVHIIAGNHDISKDFRRLDAVDAVIRNMWKADLKNPIHYYKKSGVYTNDVQGQIYNIIVYDFREKEYPVYQAQKGVVGIGMYHGAPYNMKTDEGIDLVADIDRKLFEELDYLVCGDIHKREFFTPNKNFAMVGTLICQNFKEEHWKHGYLIWDTETDKCEEVDVPNDYGFVTIVDEDFDIQDGEPVTLLRKVPFKDFQIRTKISGNYSAEIIAGMKREIKSKLKKDVTITVITDAIEHVKEYSAMNLSDVKVQNALIAEYCKKNKIADIKELQEINNEVNKLVKTLDNMYFVVWEPIELRFKNMFAFGNDIENVIDFTKLNGITAISGPNGQGKTSIFAIMLFALFSNSPKIDKMEQVINDRSNNSWVQFKLKVNGEIYRITKELVRKKTKVTTSVSFERYDSELKDFVVDDSNAVDGKADTKTDTKQMITKILGNYDDALMTTFTMQDEATSYLKRGETERRSFVYNFIGLNIFEHLYKASSKFESQYQAIVDEHKNTDFDEEIATNTLKIDENQRLIDQSNESIKDKTEKITAIDKQIIEAEKKIAVLKEKTMNLSEVETIKADIITNKNDKYTYENIIKKNKESLQNYTLKLENLRKVDIKSETDKVNTLVESNNTLITSFEGKIVEKDAVRHELEASEKTNQEIQTKITNLNTKIKEMEVSIKNYLRQTTILNDQPWMRENETCKTCLLAKDAFEALTLLSRNNDLKGKAGILLNKLNGDLKPNLSEDIKSNNKEVRSFNDKISELRKNNESLNEKKSNIQKIENNIKLLEAEIEKVNNTIILYTEKINIVDKTILELSDKLGEYSKFNEDVKELNSLEQRVKDFQADKIDNNKMINAINGFINKYNTTIGSLREKISVLETNKQTYNNAVYKLLLYKTYRDMVNKNGLPFTTLEKFIPIFNAKIEEYFTDDLTDFKLKFEIDNDKLKILTQKYGEMWRDIKSAGGREQVMSSWVIRAVLSEFSILPKSDMFILDEGFGSLDTTNAGNINVLFDKFKQKFAKILLISHIPIVADFSDNLIEVNVDDKNFSYVSQ